MRNILKTAILFLLLLLFNANVYAFDDIFNSSDPIWEQVEEYFEEEGEGPFFRSDIPSLEKLLKELGVIEVKKFSNGKILLIHKHLGRILITEGNFVDMMLGLALNEDKDIDAKWDIEEFLLTDAVVEKKRPPKYIPGEIRRRLAREREAYRLRLAHDAKYYSTPFEYTRKSRNPHNLEYVNVLDANGHTSTTGGRVASCYEKRQLPAVDEFEVYGYNHLADDIKACKALRGVNWYGLHGQQTAEYLEKFIEQSLRQGLLLEAQGFAASCNRPVLYKETGVRTIPNAAGIANVTNRDTIGIINYENGLMSCKTQKNGRLLIKVADPDGKVLDPRKIYAIYYGREKAIRKGIGMEPFDPTQSELFSELDFEFPNEEAVCNQTNSPRGTSGSITCKRGPVSLNKLVSGVKKGVRGTGGALQKVTRYSRCAPRAFNELGALHLGPGVIGGQILNENYERYYREHLVENFGEANVTTTELTVTAGSLAYLLQTMLTTSKFYELGALTATSNLFEWLGGLRLIAMLSKAGAAAKAGITSAAVIARGVAPAAKAIAGGAILAAPAMVYGKGQHEYSKIRLKHAKSSGECIDLAYKLWRLRRGHCTGALACLQDVGRKYRKDLDQCAKDFDESESSLFF